MFGSIEAKKYKIAPQTQTAGKRAVIPPQRKAPPGYEGGDGIPPIFRGPTLPVDRDPERWDNSQLDRILMIGVGLPGMELPGFDDFLRRSSDVITPNTQPPTPEKTAEFLNQCRKAGLIRRKPVGEIIKSRVVAVRNRIFAH